MPVNFIRTFVFHDAIINLQSLEVVVSVEEFKAYFQLCELRRFQMKDDF
jgi:hypothetical protein